jgi:hypothetical protein
MLGSPAADVGSATSEVTLPARQVLPHAVKLERMKQRLDLASAMVSRHMAATVKPVVGVVSDVRRMVVATPEGSAGARRLRHFRPELREAFPGGGRPAAKASGEAKTEAAAPAKAPAATEPTK